MISNKFIKFTTPNALALINLILLFTNSLKRCDLTHQLNINNNFQSVPTTVKTFENDTVLLSCNHNSPIRHVSWIREDVLILTEDTGECICEIMTAEGLATQYHAIEVQYPPSVISDPNGVFEVKIGSAFEIVCDAVGIPQPIITWKRKGKNESDHLDNTRRLMIEVTSREMSGPIECIATNGVGVPAISVPPEIEAQSPVVHPKINLRVILECHVISAPTATVHWFHHGVPVLSDIRIRRHDTDNVVNKTTSLSCHANTKHLLTIKKAKETYTTYSMGIHTATIFITKSMRRTIIGSTLFNCFITSIMAMNSSITFFI